MNFVNDGRDFLRHIAQLLEEALLFLWEYFEPIRLTVVAVNERHQIVDFSVLVLYLCMALGTFLVGCYSLLVLVGCAVMLAIGSKGVTIRKTRCSLRHLVEEADPATLHWLGEYLRERAPITPRKQYKVTRE